MIRRPYDSKISRRGYLAVYALTFATLLMMAAFLSARVVMTLLVDDYRPADAAMAGLLLGAELFLAVHATAYFCNVLKAGWRQATSRPIVFARHTSAEVALLVAAYNEAEEVLEETLASARAMDYPADLYLLDDSTNPACRAGAERVARTYGATLVRRAERVGYKAGAINDVIPRLTQKYIALLDADQKPRESWLKEMVAFMEERPRLGLVQAPQHYVNDAGLPVCHAAKHQQAIFFEFICEGKSLSNAVFCCGSNCVLRREALLSIRQVIDHRVMYFDERSVTEDFATTVLLHLKGWQSEYVNQPYAVGMGPETLPAYFTQQMRWAMGTQWQYRSILRELWRNPRALTAGQWWEHWMVATYFHIGIANFIFMLAPIVFVTLDVRAVRSDSLLYLAFFVPYVLGALNLLFIGLRLRGHSAGGVWLASALSFSTFWVYTKATLVTLFRIRRGFAVTPKSVGGAIPVRRLAVELAMCLASAATALWCAGQLVFGDGGIAYAINGAWAAYYATLLSTLFLYFNRRVEVRPRAPLFSPLEVRTTRAGA